MKKLQAQIDKRLVAAMLVIVTVIGLSAIAMHAPTQNQNPLARSLKNIQTDKTTLFYADQRMDRVNCVEMVLSGTAESKAATENLKLIAATL
jgi:predicted NBD/HSP70 family sugar kinase